MRGVQLRLSPARSNSSPPSASLPDQCPRTPRAGRVAATCLRPPSPGPRPAPSTRNRPYLSRRCGPAGGGPCSNTTTGRSGSGRGGSDPRAACAQLAAGQTPRSQGLRPPPAPVAPPGAPWGSCPPRPSALAAPAPGTGRARRRGLRCRARRDPEAARRAGRLDAGRRETGREGGRRKRTEKFAQEGAAYSLFSLPRATASGLGAGPPSAPANLPGCSSPRAQALSFAGWQQ